MASDSPRKKAAEEVADAIISGEITYSGLQDKKTEVITRLGCETPSNKEIFEIVEDADPDILKVFLEGKKEKKPSRKPSRDEKNELLKHIALIAAISIIVYANTFGNEFVWDDEWQIVSNPRMKDLGNIPSVFTLGVGEFSRGVEIDAGYYRPIFLLSLMGDYQLWGLNPFGYHLMNLLLHVLCTILLYLIVHQILGKREMSLIAALLFAVHPVHVESVAFISARCDVLFLFFFLLSLYVYIKSESDFGWTYTVSVISFFFAMFSKEMAITLPIIMILYDICFVTKKIDWEILKRLKYYLPFFAVILLYLFARFSIAEVGTGMAGHPSGNIGVIMLTMNKGLVEYIWLMLVPVNLTMLHDIPIATSILEPAVLLSTLFLFALLVFTIKTYKSYRLIFFCIAWFFITLLPVSHIIPAGTFASETSAALIAERYLYLPSIGFCILVAVIIQKLLDIFPQTRIKKVVIFCLILILALYSVRTVARNAEWKDDMILWSVTAKDSPYSEAHYNLGNAYSKKGLYNKAIAEFKEALRLNPDYADAHHNLGTAYLDEGLYDEAIAEYKEVLKINPNDTHAHNNLGIAYSKKGMYDEGIAEFKEVLRINPDDADAHYNLGSAYSNKGLYDEAIAEYKEALRINPDDADAYYNLGDAHISLGFAYGSKGMYDEAIAEFEEALRIDSDNAEIHSGLGLAYVQIGQYDLAKKEWEAALQINPNLELAKEGLKELEEMGY